MAISTSLSSELRDLFCPFPRWPKPRVLEFAPAYWKKTSEQKDPQERLAADICRQVTLGIDPDHRERP